MELSNYLKDGKNRVLRGRDRVGFNYVTIYVWFSNGEMCNAMLSDDESYVWDVPNVTITTFYFECADLYQRLGGASTEKYVIIDDADELLDRLGELRGSPNFITYNELI